MQTKRVIQHLKLIDVPSGHQFCLCCGLWQPGRPAKRLPGVYSGGICATCVQLPQDEQDRGQERVRNERRSGQYYCLEQELREYQHIVEDGVTVGDLIAQLQQLDPKAYVIFRYNDSDDGELFSRPSVDPSRQQKTMGVPYYEL